MNKKFLFFMWLSSPLCVSASAKMQQQLSQAALKLLEAAQHNLENRLQAKAQQAALNQRLNEQASSTAQDLNLIKAQLTGLSTAQQEALKELTRELDKQEKRAEAAALELAAFKQANEQALQVYRQDASEEQAELAQQLVEHQAALINLEQYLEQAQLEEASTALTSRVAKAQHNLKVLQAEFVRGVALGQQQKHVKLDSLSQEYEEMLKEQEAEFDKHALEMETFFRNKAQELVAQAQADAQQSSESLQRQLTVIESGVASVTRQFEREIRIVEQSEQQLTNLVHELSQKASTIPEQFEQMITAGDARTENFKMQLLEADEQRVAAEKEQERLRAELTHSQAQAKQHEEDLANSRDEIDSLQEQARVDESEDQAMQERQQQQEQEQLSQLQELEGQLADLSNRMLTAKENMQTTNAEVTSFSQGMVLQVKSQAQEASFLKQRHADQLESWQSMQEALKSSGSDKDKKIANLEKLINSLQTEASGHTVAKAALEKDLEFYKREASKGLTDQEERFNMRIRELERRLQEKDDRLTSLTTARSTLQAEKSRLASEQARLRDELMRTQQVARTGQSSSSEMRSRLEAANSNAQRLQMRVESLISELAAANRRADSTQSAAESASRQAREMQDAAARREREFLAAQDQARQQSRAESQRLESTLRQAQAASQMQATRLQQELSATRTSTAAQQQELQRLRVQLQRQDTSGAVATLNREIDRLKDENVQLKGDLREERTKSDSLQRDLLAATKAAATPATVAAALPTSTPWPPTSVAPVPATLAPPTTSWPPADPPAPLTDAGEFPIPHVHWADGATDTSVISPTGHEPTRAPLPTPSLATSGALWPPSEPHHAATTLPPLQPGPRAPTVDYRTELARRPSSQAVQLSSQVQQMAQQVDLLMRQLKAPLPATERVQ